MMDASPGQLAEGPERRLHRFLRGASPDPNAPEASVSVCHKDVGWPGQE